MPVIAISPADWGVLAKGQALPVLNFTAGRNLKSIAKLLTRDFIPLYDELYEKCLVAKRNRLNEIESRKIIIEAFNKVHSISYTRHDSCQPMLFFEKLSGISAMVQLYHGGDCRLNLDNVTPEQAMKILGFLKGSI